MTSKLALGLAAAVAFGLAGVAQAQDTAAEQHVDTNGALHTTVTTETPVDSTTVHRIDRPDGTTHIVKHEEDVAGNVRTTHHEVGSISYHTCHTKYHTHGDRYIHCTTHHHT